MEVEQHPSAIAQKFANGCTVVELKVGNAAACQRVVAVEIVPLGARIPQAQRIGDH